MVEYNLAIIQGENHEIQKPYPEKMQLFSHKLWHTIFVNAYDYDIQRILTLRQFFHAILRLLSPVLPVL